MQPAPDALDGMHDELEQTTDEARDQRLRDNGDGHGLESMSTLHATRARALSMRSRAGA